MSEWQSIETAPTDGRWISLGWRPNGILEHQVRSRWVNGRWEGGWTPTHWMAEQSTSSAKAPLGEVSR